MLRIAIGLFFIVLFGIGAAWLADHPGLLSADWRGYRIETSVSVAIVIFFVFLLICVVLAEFLRVGMGSASAFSGFLDKRKQRKGLEILSQGLVAVAAGDGKEARKLAKQSEKLLDDPALTLLLSAQAAQLDGDDEAAEDYFRAMLEDRKTAFLGLRGLIARAMEAGDEVAALEMARRAYSLRPQTPWVLDTLFALECKAGDWERAENVATRTRKTGLISAVDEKRRLAVLYYQRSQDAEKSGRLEDAVAFAEKAVKQSPNLGLAAVQAARLLHDRGKDRRAFKILASAWSISPHPDLLDCFRAIATNLSFEDRIKRLKTMIGGQEGHVESRLALSQIALEANDYDLSRRTLEALAKQDPQPRVFGLLAQLEQVSGDAAKATYWLKLAQNAPLDPIWVCGSCGQRVRKWSAHCPSCQTFDGLEWRSPDDEKLEIPTVLTDHQETPVSNRQDEEHKDLNHLSLPSKSAAEEANGKDEPPVEMPPLPDVPLMTDEDDKRRDPPPF